MLTSCEKFSGDQTIPAYLKIDSIGFTSDYPTWGSASHSITDAWVYVDGELIGAFPLPANFPVLKQGSHVVKILPGIKKDGIAETRLAYPFYNPVQKTINLVPDEHTAFGTATSSYSSEAKLLWEEDFEGTTISLDTTARSSVNITKTPAGSPLTFEKQHSGIVVMDTSNAYFECATHKSFDIPYADVFLEMNFKTNNSVTVGVMVYTGLIRYQVPIMTLFDTGGKWKKIYIDLATSLNTYSGATLFQVMFYNSVDAGVSHAQIVFDNIKLLTSKSGK